MEAYPTTTLQDQFLLDPQVTYLNHGSFGATPRPVFESYQRWQRELEMNPVGFFARAPALLQQSREVLGPYLGADPGSLAYVTNATTGLNIVARSLDLGPGDEVLATDHEYGALDRTWKFLAQRQGYKYINHPIPVPVTDASAFVDCLWQGVTGHTRVIFISHITSPTALIFPVAEICRRAREQGILTVIDGAHAPGQVPLDLDALGADFYSGNLHKWLCAPKGAAFLYARPERHDLIQPLIVSWGYQSDNPSGSRLVDFTEWLGTRDLSAFLAVPDAIRFQEENDWPSVRARCHALVEQALHAVTTITGQPPLSPISAGWFSQMVSAPLHPRTNLTALHQRVSVEQRIVIPLLNWNGRKLARISIQAYNTWEHVERLLEIIKTAPIVEPAPR